MQIARPLGNSARDAAYEVADRQLATGSTLGGPRVAMSLKPTGAIERIFSVDLGRDVFGPVGLRYYDEQSGIHLAPDPDGRFLIYAEHQEHVFRLPGDLAVREDVFALSDDPRRDGRDGDDGRPPAVYVAVELRNDGAAPRRIAAYALAELGAGQGHEVESAYDRALGALLSWRRADPDCVTAFGCSHKPESFETSLDRAKGVAQVWPGPLSGNTTCHPHPLGILQLSHRLDPGEAARFYLLLTWSAGDRRRAARAYRACPDADAALERTRAYYRERLDRAVVMTPNPDVNRGALWAKVNMLRTELKTPTGWAFTNTPGGSSNSVARDTAWFAFGSDYVTPEFSREALLAFVRRQGRDGMFVEYYDMFTGETEDYGFNVNDDTPLLMLALRHHYLVTGDDAFLEEVYPAAARAARLLVARENEQGLVWCTASGTAEHGIVGWRNVIRGYRLSGATTELNSECYAALLGVSHLARVLGRHDESAEFARAAEALRQAIERHLYNAANGLYYLNFDLDGTPRSDVTSDLVFPLMFGVATGERAVQVISRLNDRDFWTAAGMRTVPRDAPTYTPTGGYGLLGGVWVGVAFWYAFAAARFTPEFIDRALGDSFRFYSSEPIRYNTVPGQFSEWLHGETLANQGMTLSPWFPPRYLWAAVEGAAGLDLAGDALRVDLRLAPDWKWLGVRNLPYRGRRLTWFTVRAPEPRMYANFHFHEADPYVAYEEDVSEHVQADHDGVCTLGLRQGRDYVVFAGSTDDESLNTALRLDLALEGTYRMRVYHSVARDWEPPKLVAADELRRGLVLRLERGGFRVAELMQEY